MPWVSFSWVGEEGTEMKKYPETRNPPSCKQVACFFSRPSSWASSELVSLLLVFSFQPATHTPARELREGCPIPHPPTPESEVIVLHWRSAQWAKWSGRALPNCRNLCLSSSQ